MSKLIPEFSFTFQGTEESKPVSVSETLKCVTSVSVGWDRWGSVGHGGGETEAGQQSERDEAHSPGKTITQRVGPSSRLARLCWKISNGLFDYQVVDQNIKNVEDLQDEYDFKVNTLKNRGEEIVQAQL